MNEHTQPARNEACLMPGTLVAWRDGELVADELAHVCAHLATCVACAAAAQRVSSEGQIVADLLITLDPRSGPTPETTRALSLLHEKIALRRDLEEESSDFVHKIVREAQFYAEVVWPEHSENTDVTCRTRDRKSNNDRVKG